MKEIVLVENPEVSIIVPMYNAEKWVAKTLSSLINQSYPNFEIIIVDDGSTDNSPRIVEHFSFDSRIRYYHKENGGTGSALNYGHERAKGKYITWCSSDNLYYTQFVEVLLSALVAGEMQNAEYELVYSDFNFIQSNDQPIRSVVHTKAQSGKDLIEGYDVGMSFMYTKKLWDKTGPYWNRICEDYDWVVRAAQHTKFALVNAVLAGFRVHNDQITGSRKEEERAAADDCKKLARELYGEE